MAIHLSVSGGGGEQEEIMYEWFEPYFEPWTHYVPMRFDLSDLWEKVEWSATPP